MVNHLYNIYIKVVGSHQLAPVHPWVSACADIRRTASATPHYCPHCATHHLRYQHAPQIIRYKINQHLNNG